MKTSRTFKAGTYLAIAGILIFLGIQTAEMNFTGTYSTKQNYISDLGVNSTSAAIFNLVMIIGGILIILAAYNFARSQFSVLFSVSLLIYGIGTFGVGLFPASIGILHGISAFLLFITGPVAAISSRKYSTKSVKRISTTLGVISIIFLVAFATSQGVEQIGGLERWVVYPITMWLILFGSNINGKSQTATGEIEH